MKSMLLLFLFSTIVNAAEPDIAWLQGKWVNPDTGSTEIWVQASESLYLGMAYEGKGERVFFEFLRIEITADEIRYLAQPKGRSPTTFRLTESDNTRLVFVNPCHDFPQRIRYELVNDELETEISKEDGGDNRVWRKSRFNPKD